MITSALLRQLVPAAFFATVVTLGASTLVYPAVASAAYDDKKFQDCMANTQDPDRNKARGSCCAQAGGWVVESKSSPGTILCLNHPPTASDCQGVKYPLCSRQETPVIAEPVQIADPDRLGPDVPTMTAVPSP